MEESSKKLDEEIDEKPVKQNDKNSDLENSEKKPEELESKLSKIGFPDF